MKASKRTLDWPDMGETHFEVASGTAIRFLTALRYNLGLRNVHSWSSSPHTTHATKGFIQCPLSLNLSTRLTTTAAANATANTVGPHLSSNPPCPLIRILFARQWYVKSAYAIVAIATMVKRTADVRPMLSPKFRSPTASPPRRTVKLSHERKVRSLAKKTFGSTRVGRAMRFPAKVHKRHPLHTGSA